MTVMELCISGLCLNKEINS